VIGNLSSQVLATELSRDWKLK